MSHTKKVYTLLLTSTHVIYDFTSCDGRVVKALDLKSNGIFPRRFEPYSQRYFAMGSYFLTKSQPEFVVAKFVSCDGRVVKAFDSKSNGIFPRRFESYS